MALAIAAANALNDTLDVVEDRTNQPQRPLASGTLPRWMGVVVAGACAALSLLLSWRLGPLAFMAVAATLALGALYSLALKSTVLAGNALVGALSATPCVFAAWVSGTVGFPVRAAATFVALFVFAREVLKTAADHDGDALAGVRTAATRVGVRATLRLAELLFGVVAALMLIPWVTHRASDAYAIALLVGFFLPMIAVAIVLRAAVPGSAEIRVALRMSKVMWFTALVPLALLR